MVEGRGEGRAFIHSWDSVTKEKPKETSKALGGLDRETG